MHAVGRDGRTHSPEFEAALIEGLTAGGLDVVRIGLGPSPMLYFAVSTLDVDGGIQVTGSHNPADYNGFKMSLNGRSLFGAEIQALAWRSCCSPSCVRSVGSPRRTIAHSSFAWWV